MGGRGGMMVDFPPLKQIFEEKTEYVHLIGKLSADKIKLFIDVERLTGKSVTKDDLLKLLRKNLKPEVINEGVVDDIATVLKKERKIVERRIAKGSPPELGADGKLLLLIKSFGGPSAPVVDEKGKAALTNLHLFDNVSVGQPVARIYLPKVGKAGVSALGEVIPASSGEPCKIKIDQSLTLQTAAQGESFQLVTAAIDGYLVQRDGQLQISEELKVAHDIDYRTGSIDFIGKVNISGDVQKGFAIRAKKGIEIRGSVLGGSLISESGPISVKGTIFGAEKAEIISGESLTANTLQGVNAEIRGDIIVTKEVRDSLLRSQAVIRMPAARLIGGVTYSVGGLEAKIIGSEAEVKTEIVLCNSIEASVEYQNLLISIASHEQALELIKLHLGPLAGKTLRLELLKPAVRGKVELLSKKLKSVESSLVKLRDKKELLVNEAVMADEIKVNFLSAMYSGTIVKCEQESFICQEKHGGPKSLKFISADKKFIEGALEAIAEQLSNSKDLKGGDENGKE